MNIRTRVQVDGVVTGINRRLVYYPACDSCSGKLTILQDDKAEWSTYWCNRCSDAVDERSVHYRYCLVLSVTDKSSIATVTAFGNGWDKLFGVTATNLHKALKRYSVQTTYDVVNQCFRDSIVAAFVGCRFNFKFNVCLSKSIPRGSLTLKTIADSITHAHKLCNNLIATNFTVAEVGQFKTVLNILETKLFYKELVNDAAVFPVHKGPTTHHDNNSYLYGSWISDTISQEMCLVSLNSEHCSNHRCSSQNSLVDSVYWRWEQTLVNTSEDEEIIDDVVSHLEQSKNEFLTEDANYCNDDDEDTMIIPELQSVDSEDFDEDYTESFMKNFLLTQDIKSCDSTSMAILQATNLTDTPATKTPCAYSPELFSIRRLEVGRRSVSTPASLPLPSLAKKSTSSRIPFEDESLSSPCLFGEVDCGQTPVRKTDVTTDFTSPALC